MWVRGEGWEGEWRGGRVMERMRGGTEKESRTVRGGGGGEGGGGEGGVGELIEGSGGVERVEESSDFLYKLADTRTRHYLHSKARIITQPQPPRSADLLLAYLSLTAYFLHSITVFLSPPLNRNSQLHATICRRVNAILWIPQPHVRASLKGGEQDRSAAMLPSLPLPLPTLPLSCTM